jgi:hypothetical protein
MPPPGYPGTAWGKTGPGAHRPALVPELPSTGDSLTERNDLPGRKSHRIPMLARVAMSASVKSRWRSTLQLGTLPAADSNRVALFKVGAKMLAI